MRRRVVVIVKRGDRIKSLMDKIMKTVEHGTEIVFLMPYPPDWLEWIDDHLISIENPLKAAHYIRKVAAKYSGEEQKRLAEKALSPLREALQRKEVQTTVKLYGGNWRKAVRRYSRSCEGLEIIMSNWTWKPQVPCRLQIPSGPSA